MSELTIRPLGAEDAEGGLRLSTQAGWNHLPSDWQRSIALSPETCLGLFDGDDLAATCAITEFGELGWFGLFLVDEKHRRKGFGTKLFDAALSVGRQRGIERFALDSSDAGRPIYTRYGFELDEGIERWIGPNAPHSGDPTAELASESDWDALLALDLRMTHVDRHAQLRRLASEVGARVRIVRGPDGLSAFGFTRPGRLAGSIGPVVALNADDACAVIEALLADRHELDGEGQTAVDLLENETAKEIMNGRGFEKVRRNIRMFLPNADSPVLTGPCVYAATGLGMG